MNASDYSGLTYSPGTTTIADSGGNGGWTSGLTDLFGAASTAFTNIYRTVAPPKPTMIPPGGMILDPRSGQYIPAAKSGIDTGTILIIGLVVIGAVLIIPRLK